MSRIRDRLAPILAGTLVVVVALSVVLLLRVASDQGTDALIAAKLAQVKATADSFNSRVSTGLSSVASLGSRPWELTPGSAADSAVLKSYATDPNADSGLFLVDGDDTVTNGVLLKPGALGSRFDQAQWPSVLRQLAQKPAVVLPVTKQGLTTDLPQYAFVVAIRGRGAASVRGALVFEEALTATSPFEQEIAQLGVNAPSTAAWFFIDSQASVVATTKGTELGQRVEQPRYLTVHPGQTDLGNRIVFTADVPSIGWRVVFRQNRSQFVDALSGPLQQAGLILVLLLFAIGLSMVVLLVRRLRAAREQERRLRELNRSQAEFISVVSHELRTPVAGVLGFLQTTVDHWDRMSDPERLATVRRAVTNARRLQAMTRDVLDTETLESGRLNYAFQAVDLGAELQTAVEGSVEIDPTHRVQLTPPPNPVVVRADPDRIQQVLANLLENARKNAPPSEPIEVQTELVSGPTDAPASPGSAGPAGSPGRVRISVIDHGPGIDPDSVERIFNKFVRGNDHAVTGTGLGLYIVRSIVEAHGGRIWCESSPGRRTAFVFELPLVESVALAVVSAH